MLITTYVVKSNPAHGEVYSIQHYLIKFVIDKAVGRCFSVGTPVSSTNENDRLHITEILLKVALNTINSPKPTKHSIENIPNKVRNIHPCEPLVYIVVCFLTKLVWFLMWTKEVFNLLYLHYTPCSKKWYNYWRSSFLLMKTDGLI